MGKWVLKMNVMNDYLLKSNELDSLMKTLEGEQRNILLSGVTSSFYGPLLQMIYEKQQRPVVILMQNLYHAQRLYDQLSNLMDEGSVRLFLWMNLLQPRC